jgi:hypothetical protein
MIVELFTKNMALAGEVNIQTAAVPRVGEAIILESAVGHLDKGAELLVFEVVHALRGNTLTAIVRCQQGDVATWRRLTLQEQGWLNLPD